MESNYNIEEHCSFMRWTKQTALLCPSINCGDEDLDDFFANDAILYSDELLGKTYVWITNEHPYKVVAAFTVANDSIKSKLVTRYSLNRINRHINNHKRGRTYPAVLIGRIGVDKDFRGKGYHIGTQLLDFLKAWFRSEDNKTGCRFLLVDAYNSTSVLPFYEKCGFKFLYKTEDEEKEFYGIDAGDKLRTRMMYCDLK